MKWRYRVWEATHEAIVKSSSPKLFLNQKSHCRRYGTNSTGTINKPVPSFTDSLSRVRERWWKTF